MLDRPRVYPLSLAVLCLVGFGVLWGLVIGDRSPLGDLDIWGKHLEDWADDYTWLTPVLLTIEALFATRAMAVWTVLLAGLLWWRNHRRAAIYVVAVMLATSLLTTLIKLTVGRHRPHWQDTLHFLESKSFPSAHASSTAAFAGVLIVLALMLIRRRTLRVLAYTASVLLVVVVCADRLLLGRHFPTDVTAGALLGMAVVLAVISVYSPLPGSHAKDHEPLPQARPSQRRVAVILNPIKVEDVDRFRSVVTQMAADSGWSEPSWHYTTVEDPGTGMAEAAAVEGADLVLVCGGDGTVREVCAELAGTGIPVGIIPAGTGNLLARNLKIPLFLRAAIDVALTGQDHAIDLVEVSGDGFDDTHFMVMAGMGMDAAIMEGVNEDIKKRVGWVAYIFSGLQSVMSPPARVEITLDDGEPTVHRARTVVIGNVGFLQAGLPLIPDASIDDGRLDVVILHPKSLFSWVPLAARLLTRHPRTDDTINRMTGRQVTLRTSVDTPRQLDGDAIGPGRELRMTCIHGKLLVRVPR